MTDGKRKSRAIIIIKIVTDCHFLDNYIQFSNQQALHSLVFVKQ